MWSSPAGVPDTLFPISIYQDKVLLPYFAAFLRSCFYALSMDSAGQWDNIPNNDLPSFFAFNCIALLIPCLHEPFMLMMGMRNTRCMCSHAYSLFLYFCQQAPCRGGITGVVPISQSTKFRGKCFLLQKVVLANAAFRCADNTTAIACIYCLASISWGEEIVKNKVMGQWDILLWTSRHIFGRSQPLFASSLWVSPCSLKKLCLLEEAFFELHLVF